MKDYFYKAIEFGNLYNGMKKSCKNVRWKDSVVGYENNGLKNTLNLKHDLENGTYKLQPYQKFTIYEPKQRVIIATRIRDRQVQRSLCDCGLYDDLTEHFINDNVACQRGKGTDYAIKRLKIHLHRYYRKFGNEGWVLKCDIHHFFPSISHDLAKDVVNKYVGDKLVANEVYKVIDSFDEGIGLGSEISQLLALAVLNGLDHFIKEKLHIKYYIRYMDDFVLIHNDKEYLKYCLCEIKKELSKLGLSLNKKTDLHRLTQGIKFLSWKFKLTSTGKVVMLMDRSKISKERKRLKRILIKEANGEMPIGTAKESLDCWLASAGRGNTYVTRNNMIIWYNRMVKEIFMNFEIHKQKLEQLNISNAEDLNTISLPSNERSRQINRLIREKYSLDDEISILRKIHLEKITEDEFKEYSDYVEDCIKKVGEDK